MFYILNMLCAAPLYFACKMAMISSFTILLVFQIFIFNFFYKMQQIFAFLCDSCYTFVNDFILFFLKLIIFIACSLKNSPNIFIKSLPQCTSCLFSIILNEDIVDIEKTCCNMFAYFCYEWILRIIFTSIFSVKHSRSA